jgi:hypothetical protein
VGNSSGVTLRAVGIGLILIPINCYWIIYTEMVWWAQFPTTMSLFFNVIFNLAVIIPISLLLRRLSPRLCLSQNELLVIYVMLCMASAVASHDNFQVLIPMIGHPFWFDTPENEWAELFWEHVPEWLSIRDEGILTGYYEGESTFHTLEHIKVWARVAAPWIGFATVLLSVMLCINVILRKQWIEREKLAYPIIQLPLEMTRNHGITFFKNKTFWIAFALVSVIDVINGLNYLYPAVPLIGFRSRNIGGLFTEKPWNAIGWTPLSIYPFVVGLGFLMPVDLSFSCWFFYFFRKSQRIIGSMIAMRGLPGFPYDRQQSLGAYIGLSLFAIWASRRYFTQIFRKFLGLKTSLDDSTEPMSYRMAVLGIILGMGILVFFFVSAGMSVWIAISAFIIYYALSTGITRMRAESGAPAHDLHFMGPDYMLPAIAGARKLGAANLTVLSYFFSFNRAHRSHPMPHQLEALKLSERTGINSRKLVFVMILAVVVGGISSFWAYLYDVYRYGSWGSFAWHPYNRLQQWLSYPPPPDHIAVTFIGLGTFFTFFLMVMRMKFFWWPFHAVGYAVSGADDWCMNWLWASLVISTIAKWIILRQGGIRAHRRAIPFFLGLVLGEFVVGSIWSIIGLSLGIRTFPFKDW